MEKSWEQVLEDNPEKENNLNRLLKHLPVQNQKLQEKSCNVYHCKSTHLLYSVHSYDRHSIDKDCYTYRNILPQFFKPV